MEAKPPHRELKSVGEEFAAAWKQLVEKYGEAEVKKMILARASEFSQWRQENGYVADPVGDYESAKISLAFGFEPPILKASLEVAITMVNEFVRMSTLGHGK